jgi:probable phosphoglycerate mutase
VPRLLLLRHGQTAWNVEGRGQGHADVPLDDVGRAQAAEAGAHIAKAAPAAVWSSDSSRARDTATAIGLAVTVDARLREINLGAHEGRTLREWQAEDPRGYAAWRSGHDVRRGGGETYAEVAGRALPAVHEALAGLPDPRDLLVIVSHGGAIRALTTALLQLPAAPWARLTGLGNCCCALLVDTGDGRGWRLGAYGVTPDFLRPPASR